MLKEGDRAKVIDGGLYYPMYEEWIKKNASDLYIDWRYGPYYGGIKNPKAGIASTIIKIAEHGECPVDGNLCLVRTDGNDLLLIAGKGLVKINRIAWLKVLLRRLFGGQ